MIEWFLTWIRVRNDVDSITKPLIRIYDQLEKHRVHSRQRAYQLEAAAKEAHEAADRAQMIGDKLHGLIG